MSRIILTEEVRQNLTSRSKFFTAYLKYGKLPINESLPIIEIKIPNTTPEDISDIADIICHLATTKPENLAHVDPILIYTLSEYLQSCYLFTYCCDDVCLFVCWSLTSLCHSNGHIETMPAREINPFTALTRIRSQFLRTQ